MCIIGWINCPNCQGRIDVFGTDGLLWKLKPKEELWKIGKIYICPHCKENFSCVKVIFEPSAWDEKLKIYKCTCAAPEFKKIN